MEVRIQESEGGKADKLRFLNLVQDSAEECRYYLILTRDLEYENISVASQLLPEISKLLEAYPWAILTPEF